MKQISKILFFLCLMICIHGYAQVAPVTNNPDPSAALDLQSDNKGFLIPRLSLTSVTDKNSINGNSPAIGLLVYNTNASIVGTGAKGEGFYYWNGMQWQRMVADADMSTTYWTLGGNTLGSEKKLGTLDKDAQGKMIELPIVVGGKEEVRVLRGSGSSMDDQKKSSLRITNVPAGGDADQILVNRSNGVFRSDPLIYKYAPPTSTPALWSFSPQNTYVFDLITVRVQRGGYFATAVFTATRATILNPNGWWQYTLNYLWGSVEPVADGTRTSYVVQNVGATPDAYTANRLRLTYPNAPVPGLNFDIWITTNNSPDRTLNILDNSGLGSGNGEGYSVTLQRLF